LIFALSEFALCEDLRGGDQKILEMCLCNI
jgi:hypothetical protein